MKFKTIEIYKKWSTIWAGMAIWRFKSIPTKDIDIFGDFVYKNALTFTFYDVPGIDAFLLTVRIDKLSLNNDFYFSNWLLSFSGESIMIREASNCRLVLQTSRKEIEEILRQTYPGIEFVWDTQ